jgi:glycosyltransferase involved in cell wall biosynthesis
MMPDKALGGTELAFNSLTSLLDCSKVNLISSICDTRQLELSRPNVIWEQLSYDQENVQTLSNPSFVSMLDQLVFVSHWQHEQFFKRFPIRDCRRSVIQNAIHPFPAHKKPDGKIRLIYTSTPWRGLSVLAEAYAKLNRSDVELVVYSGTSIYGNAFAAQSKGKYDELYQRLNNVGATHIEYAPNEEIREALMQAHIFAYSNIWEETSCIAAIEALGAGCKVVTTSFGALPETCGLWADYVLISNDLVDRYAEALNQAINDYKSSETSDKLADQVAYYDKHWTWDARIVQWKKLFKRLGER